MSFMSFSLVKHVSVNRPHSGGMERGTRFVSVAPPLSSLGKSEQIFRSWRFGKNPMKYRIWREEPTGSLRARNRRVGVKCPKYRRMFGIKLCTSRLSIPSSRRFVSAEK